MICLILKLKSDFLFLTFLLKNTEETHEDYEDLVKSLKCMQDVASYINEIKRRHELS